MCKSLVKSRFISPNNTRAKYTEQSAANVPLRSPGTQGAPGRKQQRDENKWAWVVNVSPAAAAVWDERACEVAGEAARNAREVL